MCVAHAATENGRFLKKHASSQLLTNFPGHFVQICKQNVPKNAKMSMGVLMLFDIR